MSQNIILYILVEAWRVFGFILVFNRICASMIFMMVKRIIISEESADECRRCGFDPWVRKIPWRRK